MDGVGANLQLYANAMGRYSIKFGGVSTLGRSKILSDRLDLEFTVGPNDLVAPSTKMDNSAVVDVYVFKARKTHDVTTAAWGSDWRTGT